jgi:hypothetical protein
MTKRHAVCSTARQLDAFLADLRSISGRPHLKVKNGKTKRDVQHLMATSCSCQIKPGNSMLFSPTVRHGQVDCPKPNHLQIFLQAAGLQCISIALLVER